MYKVIVLLLLFNLVGCASTDPKLEIAPVDIKTVYGTISSVEVVADSQRGAAQTGIPIIDLVEMIYGNNYEGFLIYHVKVSDEITLEVGSKQAFEMGECVAVLYDKGMGDMPNLSMLGQAGISKSKGCGANVK